MDKNDLIRVILDRLGEELEAAVREAKAAADAATDPDSRAENKYDTRALEASYLARGQARRVTELQEALGACRRLGEGALPHGGRVRPGSLVTLETPTGALTYFLSPAAGGVEVRHAGREVILVTPASPMGRQLTGKVAGDAVVLRPGAPAWRVRAVE